MQARGWEVWRQIGDIIDSHISWPWKQFFAWKIVLRVILLSSIIFVASVSLVFESSCPSFVSSYCLLRGIAGLSSCRQSLSIVVTSLRRFVRFSFRRHRYMSSLELCISFNCCNRTIFMNKVNHTTRMFCRHFHSHKMQLLVLLGIFTDRNERFPYTFIYFNR